MVESKNNNFTINVISQVFILIANLGITFFLTPFIVSKLGSEAYGYVGLSNDFINYAMILTVALNSMSGRFITVSIHQNNEGDANRYFTTTFISNICVSTFLLIIGSLLIVFIEYLIYVPYKLLTDVKILFFFILLNFLISLIGSVFGVATFATNKLYIQSKRKIESYIIKILILVICYIFLRPYIFYVGIATMVSTVYTVLMDVHYQKKLLPLVTINNKYFDFSKLKEILLSGLWSSISKLSGVLSSGLNLLISNKVVGSIAMGYLSVARTLPNMILSAFGLISSVFSPDLTIYFAKNDTDRLKNEVSNSVKFLGSFSCIFIAFLIAYGKKFFMLWVPEQDSNMLYTLSILSSLALIVALPMENFWNLFIATNKVKVSSIALLTDAIITVLTLALTLFLFDFDPNMRMYMITGINSVYSILLSTLFLPIYGAMCVGEKKSYFYPVILKVLFITMLSIIIAFIINILIPINSWISLFLDTLIVGVICLILDYFLLLSKIDRNNIKLLITKFIKKEASK